MYLVSDAGPTQADVVQYTSMQKNHRLDILTKRQAAKLRRKQDELVNNYTYTTKDIERNLEERKKTGKSIANLGLELANAGIAVQGAKDEVLEAKKALSEARKAIDKSTEADTRELNNHLKECQSRVKAAEEQLRKWKEEEDKVKEQTKERKHKLAGRSKDKNWAKVNKRNINTNQRTDFEVSQKEKEAAAKKAASSAVEKFNPFARRKVKPKILWKVGQADDAEAQDNKAAGEEEKKDSRGEGEDGYGGAVDTAPNLVHEQTSDAISQSHQFTIDEEQLAQSGANGLSRLDSTKRQVKRRVRKGLSLAEYLDKKEKGTL